MPTKKNFRPIALAGLLLALAAPQASAQFFWVAKPDTPAPAPVKRLRHAPKPLEHRAEAPRVVTPARPQEGRQTDDRVIDLSDRDSLFDPEGRGPRSGEPRANGPAYASIPADADPNYSTPVDLDSSVNYAQKTGHEISDPTGEAAGTLTISTQKRRLYYSLGSGSAIEYSIAVGKAGFAWKGIASVGRKAYWPGWTPPPEMIERRPDLPDHMDGSLRNPLGARALYLFEGNKDTLFRIHGTNEPKSIGHAASSGCIRMMNADVIDLYGRVSKGARVVVE